MRGSGSVRIAHMAAPVSARSVDVPTVLHPVDQYGFVAEDLVDHSIVAATCRPKPLQFAGEWLAESLRVLGDRTEDGFECCLPNLLREPVELPQALRRDRDLVHEIASDVILEGESLARRGLLS